MHSSLHQAGLGLKIMTGTAGFLENLQSMPLCGSFILYLVGETTYSLMVLPLSCMHESGDFSVSSLDLLRLSCANQHA